MILSANPLFSLFRDTPTLSDWLKQAIATDRFAQ